MKKIFWGMFLIVAFATLAYAAMNTVVVSSTAVSLPETGNYAVCTVETNNIRISYDGITSPTTTVGHLFTPGSSFSLNGYSEVLNLRAIATGGDASLVCTVN